MFGIIFRDVKPLETNRLIADDASGSVDFARIHTTGIHAPLGAGDKKHARLMHFEESAKIQIAPIHHVKRTRFDRQNLTSPIFSAALVLRNGAQSAGGTARYVDSSLERMQIKVCHMNDKHRILICNGRPLPLTSTGVRGGAVAGGRYRA